MENPRLVQSPLNYLIWQMFTAIAQATLTNKNQSESSFNSSYTVDNRVNNFKLHLF